MCKVKYHKCVKCDKMIEIFMSNLVIIFPIMGAVLCLPFIISGYVVDYGLTRNITMCMNFLFILFIFITIGMLI